MEIPEVIRENISRLGQIQASLDERRLAHLSELAKALSENADEGFFSSDSFRESYLRATECFGDGYGDAQAEDNRIAISERRSSLEDDCRLFVCGELLRLKYGSHSPDATRFFHPETDGADNKISYLRNAYADVAYSQFARQLHTPTVTYCHDFSGVCENVYYGRTRFCILPIESSADGRLSGFRGLIAKFDLKLALTCDVPSADGMGYTRFALLQKSVTPLCATPRFFEFMLSLTPGQALHRIIRAADMCDLKLCRLDSAPTKYSDTDYAYDVLLETSGGRLWEYLCYLFLEAPQFIPVGLYDHLRAGKKS